MNWNARRKRSARRRALGRFAGMALAGLGAVFLVGLLLPAERLRTRRAVLDGSPETIWRVLTDLDAMPLWRSDLTALERLPDLAGRPTWRERSGRGQRVVEFAQADPPRRLVMQRADAGRPGLPIRTFELVSTLGGTLLILTERAETRNPLARVIARLHLADTAVDRFLKDLALRLNPQRRQVAADGGF